MSEGFRALDQSPPDNLQEHTRYLQKVRTAVNLLFQGKRNASLDVTLDANSATTVVLDPRLSGTSAIGLTPLSATAGTAMGAGIWVSAQDDGTVTLNHNNTADADKDFRLTIDG